MSRRPLVEERYRSSEDMFDGVTYSKGACVLHMLRGLVGTLPGGRGFAVTSLRTSWKSSTATIFRKAMEAASGKDLKWFFDQWVYKAGHPELKVRWRYEECR